MKNFKKTVSISSEFAEKNPDLLIDLRVVGYRKDVFGYSKTYYNCDDFEFELEFLEKTYKIAYSVN